jgi:PIN domain nuclease of toxin-antitoxin system
MKYLFDTAAFLWSVDAAERLNTRARAILESSNEEIFLSSCGVVGNRDQSDARQTHSYQIS